MYLEILKFKICSENRVKCKREKQKKNGESNIFGVITEYICGYNIIYLGL